MYKLIESRSLIGKIVEFLEEGKLLALDIETSNELDPRKGYIRTIQMKQRGKIFIIDLKTCFPGYWEGESIKEEPEILALKRLLENPKVLKIIQNAKFEGKWFRHHLDTKIVSLFDTMLADLIIDYGDKTTRHNLAAIAKKLLDVDLDKTEQNTDWKGKLTAIKLEYAAADVEYLEDIYKKQKQDLMDFDLVKTALLEFRLVDAIVKMELYGIYVNRSVYQEKIKLIEELRERAHDKLQKQLKTEDHVDQIQLGLFEGIAPINYSETLLTSPDQMIKSLRKKGVPVYTKKEVEYAELAKRQNSDIITVEVKKKSKLTGKDVVTTKRVQVDRALRAEIEKAQKTGFYATGTSEKDIQPLLAHFPILKTLYDFRGAEKMKSSYGDSFLKWITEEGRVHADYKQLGAPTGRKSCGNPNIQQVSHQPVEIGDETFDISLREAFSYPEGRIGVIADYSQIELRVLAAMSGDPLMISVIRAGEDLHSVTGAAIMAIPRAEVEKQYLTTIPREIEELFVGNVLRIDKDLFQEIVKESKKSTGRIYPEWLHEKVKKARNNAKFVNFGIIYGIGSGGLSLKLNCTEAEAQSYIKAYADTYKVAWEWLRKQARKAVDNLESRTLSGRRQLYTPPELEKVELEDGEIQMVPSKKQIGNIGRNGKNMPIQGTAADIMKLGLIYLHESIEELGLDAYVVSVVHDEATVETTPELAERVEKLLRECFVKAGSEVITSVPIDADTKIINNWGEKG